MKGLQLYVVSKCLNVDVADGAKCHPATRLKTMHKALALFVFVELLSNREKSFRRDNIQLEFTLIANPVAE